MSRGNIEPALPERMLFASMQTLNQAR